MGDGFLELPPRRMRAMTGGGRLLREDCGELLAEVVVDLIARR